MPQRKLKQYNEKRTFEQTPEPKGGVAKGASLRFVVQKHAASSLHYDFRLEIGGVLKSWAVPKGPSLDPAMKRLAMQVEDHPYDYKDFEGVIPKGNYGAGTVIIWDEGLYTPIDGSANKGKKAMERSLLAGLAAGDLKFRLFGEKLQGEFALVKTHSSHMAANAWLLIKHKDEAAAKKDLTLLDKSVVTGKTISQMAKAPANILKVPSTKKAARPRSVKKAGTKGNTKGAPAKKTKSSPQKPKAEGESNSTNEAHKATDLVAKLGSIPRSPMPQNIKPMLATLVDTAFDDPGWRFEIKWDGYRAIAYVKAKANARVTSKSTAKTRTKEKSGVLIQSRNQQDYTKKYYPVTQALEAIGTSMVIDGELVVVDKQGMPQFGALQNWRSEADGELLYYVFDLLWVDGKDVRGWPLFERLTLLKEVLGQQSNGQLRLGFSKDGLGKSFLASVTKLGLEGMVAKRKDSVYETGHRSKSWLKIKVEQRQEVIILGFTLNKGSSKRFSSLLLGVYNKGELSYVGKVGTGFSDKDQEALLKTFKPLLRMTPPLNDISDIDKPSRFRPTPGDSKVTWLKPVLVAEVSYRERTADGLFRHPSFKGLRPDKAAASVVLEVKKPTSTVLSPVEVQKKSPRRHHKEATIGDDKTKQPAAKLQSAPATNKKVKPIKKEQVTTKNKAAVKAARISDVKGSKADKKANTLVNPAEKTQVKQVQGHEIQFTHLDKLYWQKEKISKGALINYYYQMAPYILPYLKGRPQSLNRYPGGITGKSFYQKDVTGKVPDWASLYLYHSEQDRTDKHFLVADGLASLLYMVGLGCIEMNPWSSTIKKPDHPTWCIIDLDPDKKKKGQPAFEQVIRAALTTQDILKQLGLTGYPKTSGASGMHIYIPLGNKYTYEESKLLAKLIVSMVHDELPSITTLERSVAERQGKMYLDFLQNRPQATIAAPYSVRPKPGATVSMPLDWSEVKPGLRREDFTLLNAFARVQEVGDLFKPVLQKGIDLGKALRQLNTIA